MIRDLKATFEIKKYNEIFYGIIVFGAVLLSLIITVCTEDDLTLIELCASFIAGGYVGMSLFFKPIFARRVYRDIIGRKGIIASG